MLSNMPYCRPEKPLLIYLLCLLYKSIEGLAIRRYTCRDKHLFTERSYNPECGWVRTVSTKTEQLLTCGRMRVQLHGQSVTFAHWAGTRGRDQGELGSCGTRQLSLCSGVFFFSFLFFTSSYA